MDPGSTVWSDYDGGSIYGDYEVVFTYVEDTDSWTKEIVETTAYLPGIAQMDRVTGDVVYFHTDQIGTVRAISSSSASRPHYLVSTAFGERVHVDGTVGTRYQYAGAFGYETLPAWDAAAREYLEDEDVPFLHVGYRYYNPETGRFLQRDPIGIQGGLNTYAYCGNNPAGRVDPRGLMSLRPRPITEEEARESAKYLVESIIDGVIDIGKIPYKFCVVWVYVQQQNKKIYVCPSPPKPTPTIGVPAGYCPVCGRPEKGPSGKKHWCIP